MSAYPDPSPLGLLAETVQRLREDQNATLDQFRSDVNRRFDELDASVDRVEGHTRATNGRVGQLELWRARMEGARGAYHWVMPFITSLFCGGGVTLITLAATGKL